MYIMHQHYKEQEMNLLLKIILNIRNGTNQIDAARYTIIDLCCNEKINEQPNTQPNAQAYEQQNEHIITTLHLYFNYINKGMHAENFPEIKNSDKESIIKILRKLDILITNEQILQYFSEGKLLETKIEYFVINELYFSPYRIILNDLTREEFMLKLLKTEKYIGISEEKVKRFIDYFIKCLREKADKGE